jgi:hypothetical protein
MDGVCPPCTKIVFALALPTTCVVTLTVSNNGLSTKRGCLLVEVEATLYTSFLFIITDDLIHQLKELLHGPKGKLW